MNQRDLKTLIEEELWEDDGLDARRIRVTVVGRDVWLEGEVPTPAMYDLAERIVSQIGSVGDLTNSITCTEQPYDIRAHRDGEDLRSQPSTDRNRDGRMEARIGTFGEEWDDTSPLEGDELGGPVGGDSGAPTHPMDLTETAPLAADILHAEEPWRYQTDGPNTYLDAEPVLPPNEDEV